MFACLGVALALHGRHAVRARVLNVASAGASVFMNVIAAAPGWRDLAVWAMPPAAYALASDTLIGVVRAWVIARHQDLDTGLAPRRHPAGGGRRAAAVAAAAEHGPGVHAGRVPHLGAGGMPGRPRPPRRPPGPGRHVQRPAQGGRCPAAGEVLARGETKTARFLALVAERHGPLAAIPLGSVAKISAAVAPQADLNAGSARAALRRAVLAAQNGDPR